MKTLIYKGAGDIPPRDYEKIFTVDNTRLFESLNGCSFTTFIQGLVNSDEKDFQEFVRSIYEQVTIK